MKKQTDIHRSVIILLVVLAVVVSIFGAYSVVSEMKNLNTAPTYNGENSPSAKVKFEVVERNEPATGKVTLNVEKPPEVE